MWGRHDPLQFQRSSIGRNCGQSPKLYLVLRCIKTRPLESPLSVSPSARCGQVSARAISPRAGDRMKIAIMGTRGIPPAYGGFETLAWELSSRLAARGHEVTVYCRKGWTDETVPVPAGVRRRFLPYLPGKYPATVSHTALSVLDSLIRGYDAIWLGNAANAVLAGFPRLSGAAVALNVDGIERQRAKWGLVGRLWYAAGERFALVFPNVIVSDARVIQAYYSSGTGDARSSSPTARHSSIASRRRTCPLWPGRTSSRVGSSSMSAAWSPRTRPTW